MCQRKYWKTHKVTCKEAEKLIKSLEKDPCRTVDEIDARLEKYRRSAELGKASAQYSMGLLYINGVGVGVDQVEGVKWYRLAAEQGHADAQFSLGNAYLHGEGGSVDKVEDIKW